MKYLILLIPVFVFAISVKTFIHKQDCDQIINKRVYQICYNYSKKSATAVWYSLNEKQVKLPKLKTRPGFYGEKKIPKKFRTYTKDYTKTEYDRGHLANNGDFAYNKSIQKLTFSMANVTMQLPKVNRGSWKKAEISERNLALKYKKVHIVNLVLYSKKIVNGITVPSSFFKIIYNNANHFEKCYYVRNINDKQNIDIDCSLVPKYIYNF